MMRSDALGFAARSELFLRGGLHALNVGLVQRGVHTEIPTEAKLSPSALMEWLREPAVIASTVSKPHDFLPTEAPDWDPDRPATWIAAESQFCWIARLADGGGSGDPDVELWGLDGPGYEEDEKVLAVVPLSELTARLYLAAYAPDLEVWFSSSTATAAQVAGLPGASAVYPARPAMRWDGLIYGDDWAAKHGRNGVWVAARAGHATGLLAQLQQRATDWTRP